MNDAPLKVRDWASDVAEKLIGDIPQLTSGRWASDATRDLTDMLREQLSERASRGRMNTFVEHVVRELPDYLPEHVSARLRAKMLGALLTAGAIGEDLRKRENSVSTAAPT